MRDFISSICVLVGFMIGLAVGITVERARIIPIIENMADEIDKLDDGCTPPITVHAGETLSGLRNITEWTIRKTKDGTK